MRDAISYHQSVFEAVPTTVINFKFTCNSEGAGRSSFSGFQNCSCAQTNAGTPKDGGASIGNEWCV